MAPTGHVPTYFRDILHSDGRLQFLFIYFGLGDTLPQNSVSCTHYMRFWFTIESWIEEAYKIIHRNIDYS